MRLAAILALGVMLAAGGAQAAESPAVTSARATATLISDTDAVAPGAPFRLGLRLRLAEGWHTYWRNPGDAGVAPELQLTLPAGVTAGPVAWPAPEQAHEGPLTTFGYTGEVVLPVSVSGATGAVAVQAHAEWLVCAKVCVPESGDFRLDLPQGTPAPAAEAGLFAAADRRAPRPSPFAATLAADGTLFVAGLTGVREAWFAADAPDITQAATGPAQDSADGLRLTLKPGAAFRPGEAVSGVLRVRDASGADTALRLTAQPGAVPAASPAEAGAGVWRLLGLAFLGGLVLNLMPCVFPVLVIKAMGLSALAGARQRTALLYAASYTGGVLVAFAGLAAVLLTIRAAGGAAGWGFQFQAPGFVAVTAWVLVAVGLNLSGVFDIRGGRLAGAGTRLCAREGQVGSFFTGLLAVLVATPCTAPFMGAAVAGALAASPGVGAALFLAMGLGLAAPYVLLATVPGFARALPRPGRWMLVAKQALAFPMYGAAVWLVWVVSQQAGPFGVLATAAGVLLVGFAAWALGLAQRSHGASRWIARGLAAASLVAFAGLAPQLGADAPDGAGLARTDGAEPFSNARLAALRQDGRPVFVDMTAAWCVTCLVNERVALAPQAVRAAFAERRVAYLKGDWTRQDPEITEFLRRHGRDGVPLYVFYPGDGGEPAVLPQILTQGIVLGAIARSPG